MTAPGVRVGQLWRSRQPRQRLPWLRIQAVDHTHVDGRLSAVRDSAQSRYTRILRNQLEQNYQLVEEPTT